ncbi:hypothetical protein [Saccharicrinis sp. FJH54]|uniref:hypothetical protein n=1 Tax=Saccharicrinis sp. FJH54 TaxID=3344665 RepID=UPI0035D45000
MHHITTDHKRKIIIYKHYGTINLGDLQSAWLEILNINMFSQGDYNLLADYRNAKFNFEFKETNVVLDFLLTIKDILKGKKEAVIVDNPQSTVMSMLVKKEIQKIPEFRVEIFSTSNAAYNWLR